MMLGIAHPYMNKTGRLRRFGAIALLFASCLYSTCMLSATARAEDILNVALSNLPSGRGNVFNSTSGLPGLYTYAAIFDGLTRVDGHANAVPMLAESWVQDSPKSWTFSLRPDITFSNGEPFNADAVVFAINLIKSPEHLTYPIAVELSEITGADVVDDRTVRIRTENTDVLLPNLISALKFVAPRYWQQVGADEFALRPVGTGPFEVTSWTPTRAELVRAETAWRQPKFDKLHFIVAIEPSVRLQSVLSGQADIAVALGAEDIEPIESAGHKMFIGSDGGVQALAFNTVRVSPIQNADVRRALNYAIDRNALSVGLLGKRTPLASQPSPPGAFGHDDTIDVWPYDPVHARELLAQAGYPDGFSFVAEIRTGLPPETTSFYQQIAADLAKINVHLEVRAIPGSQYARGIYDGEWQGEAVGIDYGLIPSLDALKPIYRHSCLWPKPWYCDPTILPLVAAAAGAETVEQRRTLTEKVMRHQVDQAAAIFMFELTRFDGVASDIEGYGVEVGFVDYAAIGRTPNAGRR
ncbi:MAG: ABC transporter substrate-binding protein [Rhodobacteraceae bacterium]|nr:ABC transporter substrate-binding protein [Paracoccaceae bacterium]